MPLYWLVNLASRFLRVGRRRRGETGWEADGGTRGGRHALDEGRHALGLVVGGEERMKETALEAEALGEGQLVGGSHGLLQGRTERERERRGEGEAA